MSQRQICALIVLACAAVAASAAEEPQWLQEARAREAKPANVATLKSKDGFFTAQVPAKVTGNVEQDETAYTSTFDIGSQSPMTCEVFKGGFDVATTLRNVATNTFTNVEKLQGKLEAKGVERQDAGVIDANPFMSVDWIYRVNDGKGARLGALKQFAAAKAGHGVYCAHVDLGFTKTFRTIAEAFVQSLSFTDAAAPPQYLEVSTATLGDRRIGFAIVSLAKDAEGDLKLVNSSALLVPVALDTLTAQDSYHIQWAHPDASLINATHVVSTNGELDAQLALTQAESGGWNVEGTFKQKAVKQAIESTERPVTWLEQARSRRALFDQSDVAGKSISEHAWVAVSPTAFVESKVTVVRAIDTDHLAARETAAGLTMDVVLDRATGMPTTATMALGPQELKLERILTRGTL